MYLGKLFLGMRTIINRIFKENSLTVTSGLFSRLKAKLVTCLHLTTEFHRSYVLTLSIDFGAVAAMLPIMAKINAILKSKCVNT